MDECFELIEVDDKSQWNEALALCCEADLQQTWEYGQAVHSCIDWTPVRQIVMRENRPVALAQALVKEVPALGPVARIQNGPSFIEPGLAVEAIDFLRGHWVDERGMTLHLSPCLLSDDLGAGWNERIGLQASDESCWSSIRVDLTQDPQSMRDRLSSSFISSLKQAENKGTEVGFFQDDESFEFFIEKYRAVVKERGIVWPSVDLVCALRKESPESMTVAFASKAGEKIAALVTFAYGPRAQHLVLWVGPDSGKQHAQNLLAWRSAIYYREKGCRWCDLGGIDPKNLPGINEYKRDVGAMEYSLVGAFEAKPEGMCDKIVDADYRKGLGHIFHGLDLPEDLEKDDSMQNQVYSIIGKFVEQSVGMKIELTDDLSLLDGGFLDSISIVNIVQALQDAFDIEVGVPDITIDNFDTLQAICALVKSKIDEK